MAPLLSGSDPACLRGTGEPVEILRLSSREVERGDESPGILIGSTQDERTGGHRSGARC